MAFPDEDGEWGGFDDDEDDNEVVEGLGSANEQEPEDEVTAVTKMFDDINSSYSNFRAITRLLDLLARFKDWTLSEITSAIALLTSDDPVIQQKYTSILPPAPVIESTKPVLNAIKSLYRVIHENALHVASKEGDRKAFKSAYTELFPEDELDSSDKLEAKMEHYKNRQVVDDVVTALFSTPAG